MDMDSLTSGQMAKINRVSDKALRVYEKKGILVPKHVDEATGRRHYSIQQSVKLDMIQQLQHVGLSLEEIAEVNDRKDIRYLRETISEHRSRLDEQLKRITAARQMADDFIESCDTYLNMPLYDQIMFENLPPQRIIKIKIPPKDGMDTTRKPSTVEAWEMIMRYTKRFIIDNGYPAMLFHDIGSLLSVESLENEIDPFITHTFVFLDNMLAEECEGSEILPRGHCLTLYGNEAYDEKGFSLSEQRIGRLRDYADKKGLEIAGSAFGETLCRWPRQLDERFKLGHRLCLPVRYEHERR